VPDGEVWPPMLPPKREDDRPGSLSAYPPRENAPTMSRATEAALRNDLAEARRENSRLRDRIEAAEVRRQKQITVTPYEGVSLVRVFVPELDRMVTFWASQEDPRLRPEEG
jgi:hypothetical protein